MMTDWIIQIWMLTILFSLLGSIMLILRRVLISRGGEIIKQLWIIVLIAAVLPMYLLPVTLPDAVRREFGQVEWFGAEERSVGTETETPFVEHPKQETANNRQDAPSMAEEAVSNSQIEREAEWLSHGMHSIWIAAWAVGAMCFLGKCQFDKRRFSRDLKRFAEPCDDEDLQALLAEIATSVGVRRNVSLYVIGMDYPIISPCTVGYFHPRIYLHMAHVNDPLQTRTIVTHEIQHLRGKDAIYKNAVCAVLALHWFNPLTYWIMPRIFEDCELACDRRTLKTLGEERRISYMKTILNIAASVQPRRRAGYAAQFFCEPNAKQTVKRRYRNLEGKGLHPVARFLALCLAVMMVFACVGCQLIGKKKNTLHLLTPLTEEMVRFYYDLSPEDTITQEMLDGVTSLFVFRDMNIVNAISEYENEAKLTYGAVPDIPVTEEWPWEGQRYTIEELAEFSIVDFEVNFADTEGSFAAMRNQGDPTRLLGCMNYIPRNYMETVVFSSIQKAYAESEEHEELHTTPDGGLYVRAYRGDYFQKQFMAYWVLKDYDLLTSEQQKQKILMAFPGCDEYPCYIFDPTANRAELMRIYVHMGQAGLLDNRILSEGTIDPDIFKVFPNLTDLHIVGIPQA